MSEQDELIYFKGDLLKKLVKNKNRKLALFNKNYLVNLNDNLIRNMSELHYRELSKGNGNELMWTHGEKGLFPPKMQAVHSSSALFYNVMSFLSNKNTKLKYNEFSYKEIYFEKKYKLLKIMDYDTNLMKDVEVEANPDGYLEGEYLDIVIESKFIENIEKHSLYDLHKSYLDSTFYLVDKDNNEYSNKWINLFQNVITNKKTIKHSYVSKYQNYDALQVIKHLLGVFNYCVTNNVQKNIELINVIWNFTNKDHYPELAKLKEKEFEEAKEVEHLINNYLITNFSDMKFKLSFTVMTYDDFIDEINLKDIDIETYNYYNQRYKI